MCVELNARRKSNWQMTLPDENHEINFGCLSWVIRVLWSIRQKVLQPALVSPKLSKELKKWHWILSRPSDSWVTDQNITLTIFIHNLNHLAY